MQQVVVFPRGQLSEKDRRALQRKGVCVVETDDPSKVVSVLPTATLLGADDMLRAALAAMAGGGYADAINKKFVTLLEKAAQADRRPT